MDNQEINNGRRRFLTLATCGAGGVAALGVATPFVASFFPSEKAKAAGAAVEVDVSKIEAGQMLTAEWQGKPIWLVNRTDQQLKDLKSLDGAVTDPNSEVDQQPEYAKNEHRSIKPNLLVAIGICTHLGCSPTYRPDVALRIWVQTGKAVSSALATVRNSTWQAAYTKVFLHRPIWLYRLTNI